MREREQSERNRWTQMQISLASACENSIPAVALKTAASWEPSLLCQQSTVSASSLQSLRTVYKYSGIALTVRGKSLPLKFLTLRQLKTIKTTTPGLVKRRRSASKLAYNLCEQPKLALGNADLLASKQRETGWGRGRRAERQLRKGGREAGEKGNLKALNFSPQNELRDEKERERELERTAASGASATVYGFINRIVLKEASEGGAGEQRNVQEMISSWLGLYYSRSNKSACIYIWLVSML